ncbi:MAG: hypothetical protein GX783_04670 [Clostridiales bacterium]|nr:hypothetical protein [Clostridiales bacterium]
MAEELERICCNCNQFISDLDDFESEFGICLRDDVFDEHLDEVFGNSSFSSCRDLFEERKFDGFRQACADFEEIEYVEDEELEEESELNYEELDKLTEVYRTQDVDDIAKYLYAEEEYKDKAISLLLYLMNYRNENAFKAMMDYYKSLPSVESIDDVHFRLKILECLYRFNPNESCSSELIEMLVDELYKMQSNNTTRQLFSSILKFLSSSNCELDMITDKLAWLLDNRKFSPKMKQNILSVTQEHKDRELREALFRERHSR